MSSAQPCADTELEPSDADRCRRVVDGFRTAVALADVALGLNRPDVAISDIRGTLTDLGEDLAALGIPLPQRRQPLPPTQ